MQADILGIPVLVSSTEEATALGAALCAAVTSFTTVEPQLKKRDEYEPHYQRWLRLFEMRSQLPDDLTWPPL